MSFAFPASRASALAQLRAFAPRVAAYRSGRNHVLPDHPHVSRLSPALRSRLISEEEVVAEIRTHCSFTRAEKFVQEILWRGYWKSWLEKKPHVWTTYRHGVAEATQELAHHPSQREKIAAVLRGESGVALMDYFTRELIETGYLHNHARMWWASFWIHVEQLPWELGADFFYRHLLDADPASNTLSWRWVAGLQTRGKAYLVRRSNLEKYVSRGLLQEYSAGLEQLKDELMEAHLPRERPFAEKAPAVSWGTSLSSVPQGRWGLWLHGEDLSPETCAALFPTTAPQSIQGFLASTLLARFQLSPARQTYLRTVLQDGLERAQAHWQAHATLSETTSLAEALTAWIARDQLKVIYAMAPFVGPLAEELPVLQQVATEGGAQFILLTRPWDLQLQPWAQRGYFTFWEKAKTAMAW